MSVASFEFTAQIANRALPRVVPFATQQTSRASLLAKLRAAVMGLLLAAFIAATACPTQAQPMPLDWQAVVGTIQRLPVRQRHLQVNDTVNSFDYVANATVWQTPSQLADHGVGDCKDLAFTKYWLLSQLGIPRGRMRLGYGEWVSPEGPRLHMVLLLWDGQASPLVLDNLMPDIMRLNERTDLRVKFSFDERAFFDQATNSRIQDQPLRGWAPLRALIVEATQAKSLATRAPRGPGARMVKASARER
jgi:Bacterial transglutaminase-like cysteine proteinase BTLCP